MFRVNRNCFYPVPNVDSAVISLSKNNKYDIKDMKKLERLIKDSFQHKRKNLRNNLKNYNLDIINKILQENNYNLGNRAEEIPIDVYVEKLIIYSYFFLFCVI